MTKAALMGDIFVVDDAFGDTNKVDVVWNRDIGSSFLDILATKLKHKGYAFDRTMLSSVGLMVARNQLFKYAKTFEDQQMPEASLLSGSPPFYLNEELQIDTVAKQSIESIYRSLIQVSMEGGPEHVVIQDAATLGERSGLNYLCVFFIGGFNVPFTQRIKDGQQSYGQTVGGVGIERISRVSIAFYIIDTAAGELIWADHQQITGGIIYLEKLEQLATDIVERRP